jgi:hypothetical protein
MTIKNNRAGRSTRKMAEKRRSSGLSIGLVGIGILLILFLLLQNSKAIGLGGSGLLVLMILVLIVRAFSERQMNQKFREEKRAIRGAKAEEKMGDLLDDLSGDFYILNDIECPYGNIDHIIIGKNNGIYLIETKAHGGKVEIQDGVLLVNGKQPEKDFLTQILKNTYWLRDEISDVLGEKPWIKPIIVFTNAFVVPCKPIKNVRIINKNYLPKILERENTPSALYTHIWELKEKIEDKLI